MNQGPGESFGLRPIPPSSWWPGSREGGGGSVECHGLEGGCKHIAHLGEIVDLYFRGKSFTSALTGGWVVFRANFDARG